MAIVVIVFNSENASSMTPGEVIQRDPGRAPEANAFLRILGSQNASHDKILVVCV